MTRLAILFLAAFTATTAVLLSGCGGDAADVEAGRRINASHCASCHGASGEGGSAPSLVGIGRVFETAEGQEAFVKTGGAEMPVFGQILTDAQVRDVVVYTRDTFR